MTYAEEIVCPRCESSFPLGKIINLCPCGSPLLVRYDLKRVRRAVKKSALKSRPATLWRYQVITMGSGMPSCYFWFLVLTHYDQENGGSCLESVKAPL